MSFNNFISFQNLYRLYLKCRRNKRNTINQLKFEIDLESNLLDLQQELQNQTYRPSRSVCFIVKKPKFREIFAADFRDRILHHLLYEQYEKIWESKFIFDSYSCRKNKGTHLAIRRLQSFLRKITANNTQNAYCLALDIRGFFMNINKEVLYKLLSKKLSDPFLLWLSKIVIFNDCCQNYLYKGDPKLAKQIPTHKTLFGNNNQTGLPIGNLTSQFYANLYLNELDQYVKHNLKCRYYMRYVDDALILNKNRSELEYYLYNIDRFLRQKLKLELNLSKCRITTINSGLDYLGYIVRPFYILVRNRVVNNLKARLREFRQKLVKKIDNMLLLNFDHQQLVQLQSLINSYFAHFNHADCHKLKSAILNKYHFLLYFFDLSKGKADFRLNPKLRFADLYSQYQYFFRKFASYIILFQVGCYYETYGRQAKTMHEQFGLNYIKPRNRLGTRTGFPVKHLLKYLDKLCRQQFQAVVIEQSGIKVSKIETRKIKYLLIQSVRQGETCPGQEVLL